MRQKCTLAFQTFTSHAFQPRLRYGGFPHSSLKALNEKINDSLKTYLVVGLKAFLKSLTRFSVPMFSPIRRR
jgi:hypothetical protein